MTERPTPETDQFVEPFNARELLVTARRLERERDEALAERDAVVKNAMRLLTDGCEVHPLPEIGELKGCIVCVKAERDALREALRELVRLKNLHDRIESYGNPVFTGLHELIDEYNRCKPLAWDRARALLGEAT